MITTRRVSTKKFCYTSPNATHDVGCPFLREITYDPCGKFGRLPKGQKKPKKIKSGGCCSSYLEQTCFLFNKKIELGQDRCDSCKKKFPHGIRVKAIKILN